MPDFVIDFCQSRRDEVIDYVQKKYGTDYVAQIITFGKLQARAVLKDVGRVLQMPYSQVDRICKLIPFNAIEAVTLEKAIEMDKDLQQAIQDDPQINKLVSIALKLEGLNRHASTHAAGVVIGDRPLREICALYNDEGSTMPAVGYSMKYAESAGLVKFDFLGLKTLTTILETVKLVYKTRAIKIDIAHLRLDDKKTFEMLASGDSIGVFQIESSGMRAVLRQMRADKIEDIIALISLYRPGPMDNIPTYIRRKHGEEKISYPHPLLEAVLKETNGVIVYQEQVMEIAKILAGYSLGGADLLRRAMGKKIKEEMDQQRKIFVEGAKKNNVPDHQANEIFDLVDKFAGYGFNKSHAAAYAMISYQTAYLKAHFLPEFLTASINLEIDNTDKINIFLQVAKSHKIPVLAPDINQSQADFSIEILN
jgi:DNA polymerase-3 subunit alpha